VGLGGPGRRAGRGLAVRPPARRSGHRVRADIRKVNDERYSHAGSMDPFMGAGTGSYARVEDTARADAPRAAEAECLARDPDDRG
jgi:hypothetical protein